MQSPYCNEEASVVIRTKVGLMPHLSILVNITVQSVQRLQLFRRKRA